MGNNKAAESNCVPETTDSHFEYISSTIEFMISLKQPQE